MPAPELNTITLAQWYAAISSALKAHDVHGVAALVQAMAVFYPHEAENIRQTLLLGIEIATRPDRKDPA